MRKFAVIVLVFFLLITVWCVCNLISGGKMGETGNSIVGLAVSISPLIFCFLYLTASKILDGHSEYLPWEKIRKIAMRYLAGWNVMIFGLIIINGIYNIIFGVNYRIGISIVGLIMFIPMLIFFGRYLRNDLRNEAINQTKKHFEKIEGGDANK